MNGLLFPASSSSGGCQTQTSRRSAASRLAARTVSSPRRPEWIRRSRSLFLCRPLCLHCEESGSERERAGRGESVRPELSQLSPRCLTEAIVSDRGRSHEPELTRNKSRFSRSEETAVLNKNQQQKRLIAEDKVQSCPPPSPRGPPSPAAAIPIIKLRLLDKRRAGIVSVVLPVPHCVEVNYWRAVRK